MCYAKTSNSLFILTDKNNLLNDKAIRCLLKKKKLMKLDSFTIAFLIISSQPEWESTFKCKLTYLWQKLSIPIHITRLTSFNSVHVWFEEKDGLWYQVRKCINETIESNVDVSLLYFLLLFLYNILDSVAQNVRTYMGCLKFTICNDHVCYILLVEIICLYHTT